MKCKCIYGLGQNPTRSRMFSTSEGREDKFSMILKYCPKCGMRIHLDEKDQPKGSNGEEGGHR